MAMHQTQKESKICNTLSQLGSLKSYARNGNLDIREYLKIYLGADKKAALKDAAPKYIEEHYPKAYKQAYSLPEGYILNNREFNTQKKSSDIHLPQESVSMVFNALKDAFRHVPSLTIFEYAFTDTLLKGIDKKKRKEFIDNLKVPVEALESGDHDVFGIGIFGKDIVGIFFQIKATTSKSNQKTFLKRLEEATKQIKKDLTVFCTMCGEFLNGNVKLAGFAAFPMLSKSDLKKLMKSKDCTERILTSDDLRNEKSFQSFFNENKIELKEFDNPEPLVMQSFKDIFDLYICAASAVNIPRNPTDSPRRGELNA
ncbi:unnamed protein product [Darwinula stevensoni]|uniref:Uncharacterized protein n=1 Tax=Darwinula stevensoni TaxID=69355 RepID=A0A7R9A6F0_9CRUS|nr:unnamed protein product [Darwinula stevensoni]CAG0888971.1 unnamed protein product [Darwinula stevensoni]